MSKRTDTGIVSVTGPGITRDGLPSVGVGLSVAQGAACRADQDATWYVREAELVVFHVTRDASGVVTTTAANGVPAKGPVAEAVEL